MKILGIETSCDETAAAVVENGRKILSSVVASSAEMHIKTGGIIPETAARQQVRSIIPVIQETLRTAFNDQTTNYNLLATKIDAIAVTVGPGLIGSLLVGVETAKTLSYLWKKPIVPVNHLVGHIYANWLTDKPFNRGVEPKFPALALVVSGGHTDLVLMKDHGNLKWIGGTRDDAAGEAFDKCARLLGLPYPGGPSISKEAEKFFNLQPTTYNPRLNFFPRPLINEDNFDWSFSGLKTAVLRETEKIRNGKTHSTSSGQAKKISRIQIPKLAAEIQEAIVDSLVKKIIKAIKKFRPKSFLLAGGVAANNRLREKFTSRINTEKLQVIFHVPDFSLCTDNASYIASFACYNYKSIGWKKIKAIPDLTIIGEV